MVSCIYTLGSAFTRSERRGAHLDIVLGVAPLLPRSTLPGLLALAMLICRESELACCIILPSKALSYSELLLMNSSCMKLMAVAKKRIVESSDSRSMADRNSSCGPRVQHLGWDSSGEGYPLKLVPPLSQPGSWYLP